MRPEVGLPPRIKATAAVNRAKYDEITSQMKALGDLQLRVGVLASKGGDRQHPNSKLTLCDIAVISELGSSDGRIPARMPIQKTLQLHRKEIIARQARAVKRVIESNADPRRELLEVGGMIANRIRATIDDRLDPPNAPSTIRRKGSDIPLIDTGRLRAAYGCDVIQAKRGSLHSRGMTAHSRGGRPTASRSSPLHSRG